MIRPGAIGDCIVSLPAIDSIKEDYKEVWTPSAVVPLVRRADLVDPISRTGLDLLGLPSLAPPPALLERLGTGEEAACETLAGPHRAPARRHVEGLGSAPAGRGADLARRGSTY